MPEIDPLALGCALALTGDEPAARAVAGSAVGSTATDIADALASQGWEAARLQQLRAQCQADELPWPFAVPREVMVDAGFARFAATLAQLRKHLGLDGLVPTIHTGPKVLGPAERRLLAEVPPHHGFVG